MRSARDPSHSTTRERHSISHFFVLRVGEGPTSNHQRRWCASKTSGNFSDRCKDGVGVIRSRASERDWASPKRLGERTKMLFKASSTGPWSCLKRRLTDGLVEGGSLWRLTNVTSTRESTIEVPSSLPRAFGLSVSSNGTQRGTEDDELHFRHAKTRGERTRPVYPKMGRARVHTHQWWVAGLHPGAGPALLPRNREPLCGVRVHCYCRRRRDQHKHQSYRTRMAWGAEGRRVPPGVALPRKAEPGSVPPSVLCWPSKRRAPLHLLGEDGGLDELLSCKLFGFVLTLRRKSPKNSNPQPNSKCNWQKQLGPEQRRLLNCSFLFMLKCNVFWPHFRFSLIFPKSWMSPNKKLNGPFDLSHVVRWCPKFELCYSGKTSLRPFQHTSNEYCSSVFVFIVLIGTLDVSLNVIVCIIVPDSSGQTLASHKYALSFLKNVFVFNRMVVDCAVLNPKMHLLFEQCFFMYRCLLMATTTKWFWKHGVPMCLKNTTVWGLVLFETAKLKKNDNSFQFCCHHHLSLWRTKVWRQGIHKRQNCLLCEFKLGENVMEWDNYLKSFLLWNWSTNFGFEKWKPHDSKQRLQSTNCVFEWTYQSP